MRGRGRGYEHNSSWIFLLNFAFISGLKKVAARFNRLFVSKQADLNFEYISGLEIIGHLFYRHWFD